MYYIWYQSVWMNPKKALERSLRQSLMSYDQKHEKRKRLHTDPVCKINMWLLTIFSTPFIGDVSLSCASSTTTQQTNGLPLSRSNSIGYSVVMMCIQSYIVIDGPGSVEAHMFAYLIN